MNRALVRKRKRVNIGEKLYKVESFEPLIGKNNVKPHTLIVGTMPSITSHGTSQYYGHRSNAFWWIVGDALNFRRGGQHIDKKWPFQFGFNKDGKPSKVQAPILKALKDTKRFGEGGGPILSYEKQVERIHENGYILWDVLQFAEIINSDDNSIKKEIPNDVLGLLSRYPTLNRIVFASGGKSASLFKSSNKIALNKLLSSKKPPYHFISGNDAANNIFKTNNFLKNQPNTSRAIELIVPISVSPAAASKTFQEKSNNWMELVFNKKPLYSI
jgi:G:T/U-mismatch repair DNA glycosylase